MSKSGIFYVLINGYGAPAEPTKDPTLRRYLLGIMSFLGRTMPESSLVVYSGGGYTNSRAITEAEALTKAWSRHCHSITPCLRDIPCCPTILGDTARENLCLLWQEIGDVPVIIFCEYSRRFGVRFLARQYFSNAQVVGIRFDLSSLTLRQQLQQLLVRLPLEVAAWYWPPADKLRLWLRQGHVKRVRAREAAATAEKK